MPDYKQMFMQIRETIIKNDEELFHKGIREAMTQFSDFDFNQLDSTGSTLLDTAIQKKRSNMVLVLIGLNADVNKPTTDGVRPLTRAITLLRNDGFNSFSAERALVDIITQLVNHSKIDLKQMYDENCLLAALATTMRISDFPKIHAEIAALITNIRKVVALSHRFDITGKTVFDGFPVSLDGIFAGLSTMEIMQSFNEFLINSVMRSELNTFYNDLYSTRNLDYFDPKMKEVDLGTAIQVDLSCLSQPIDMKFLMERHTNKQVTPLFCITEVNSEALHAIAYVLYDNIIIRINRGYSSDPKEKSGLTFYQINDMKVFWEEIPVILNSLQRPIPDTYFFNEFIRKAALKPIFYIPLSSQIAGNCTVKSLEGAILALTAMHLYRYYKRDESLIRNTESECLHWSQIEGMKFINLFLGFDKLRSEKQFLELREKLPSFMRNKIEQQFDDLQKTRGFVSWLPAFKALRNGCKDVQLEAEKVSGGLRPVFV